MNGCPRLIVKLGRSFLSLKTFTKRCLDEGYQAINQAGQRTSRILNIFAVLTIFVACLGLFSLATFTAEQRTKQIGVRKVLGASVTSIVNLLAQDFLKYWWRC